MAEAKVIMLRRTDDLSTTSVDARVAPAGPVLPMERGEQVTALQHSLVAWGFSPGAADGIYGDATRGAVMALQRVLGRPPTGNYDEATMQAVTADLQRNDSALLATGGRPRIAPPPSFAARAAGEVVAMPDHPRNPVAGNEAAMREAEHLRRLVPPPGANFLPHGAPVIAGHVVESPVPVNTGTSALAATSAAAQKSPWPMFFLGAAAASMLLWLWEKRNAEAMLPNIGDVDAEDAPGSDYLDERDEADEPEHQTELPETELSGHVVDLPSAKASKGSKASKGGKKRKELSGAQKRKRRKAREQQAKAGKKGGKKTAAKRKKKAA